MMNDVKRVLTEIYDIEPGLAQNLVQLAAAMRRLEAPGLSEVASTRALVSTGKWLKKVLHLVMPVWRLWPVLSVMIHK